MSYKLLLTDEAERQLLQWKRSGQKKDIAKIISLFQELEEHPTTGTGHFYKTNTHHSMSVQSEEALENGLIATLKSMSYEYVQIDEETIFAM